MNILLILKSIKFFIKYNRVSQYILNYSLFIIKKYFNRVDKNQVKPKSLGKFQSKINPDCIEELKVFNNNLEDIDYIQSLRNLIDKDTEVYLINIRSEILLKFLVFTLKKKINLLCNFENFKKIKNVKFFKNKTSFFERISDKNIKSIVIIDNDRNIEKRFLKKLFLCNIVLSKPNLDYLKPKNYNFYFFDIFGKINLQDNYCIKKYNLYSKDKLVKKNHKTLISGISVLKNLDLYPFDICYESVLSFVDNFHLGIDKTSFKESYKRRLNKFLQQTKYRKKINLHFFDFKSETVKNCYIKGRWIADAFNIVSNKCQSKYILNLGADEFFETNLNKNFYNYLKQDSTKYEEYKFKFSHLLEDFNFIRNPQYAAYNEFTRIFERNKYVCNFDGMGFRKINSFRPFYKLVNINIFHIGYLKNFQTKKINTHFSNEGIFYNLGNMEKFKKNFYPVKISKELKSILLKSFEKYNYLDSYKIIKKNIK